MALDVLDRTRSVVESDVAIEGFDPLALERDLWGEGFEANRAELETAIDYAVRDGLLEERVDPESLFVPGSQSRSRGRSDRGESQ